MLFTSSPSSISPSRSIFPNEKEPKKTKKLTFQTKFYFRLLLLWFSFPFFSFAVIWCLFDQSTPWSSALMVKISPPVSFNIPGAHLHWKTILKTAINKIVECPNDLTPVTSRRPALPSSFSPSSSLRPFSHASVLSRSEYFSIFCLLHVVLYCLQSTAVVHISFVTLAPKFEVSIWILKQVEHNIFGGRHCLWRRHFTECSMKGIRYIIIQRGRVCPLSCVHVQYSVCATLDFVDVGSVFCCIDDKSRRTQRVHYFRRPPQNVNF